MTRGGDDKYNETSKAKRVFIAMNDNEAQSQTSEGHGRRALGTQSEWDVAHANCQVRELNRLGGRCVTAGPGGVPSRSGSFHGESGS